MTFMAIAERVRARTRTHPRVVTAVVTLVAYAVVVAAFLGAVPFPALTRAEVVLFSDLIALVNAAALTSLLAGWRFVRRGEITRHRRAMLSAFGLIAVFLVLYVWKQSGGFTKEFVVPPGSFLAAFAGPIAAAYLLMLAVHVLLSILAVPVVVHAVVLGLTHTPEELRDTVHPRVGRVAVAAWALSLALGILTYLMLNHVYGWEAVRAAAAVVAAPATAARGRG